MLREAGRKLRFFLAAVFSILFVCFAVINRHFIHISLFPFPYTAQMPVFVFAVVCFALGLVVGGTYVSAKLSRMKRLLKSEHRQVMALENQVNAMNLEKNVLVPAGGSH